MTCPSNGVGQLACLPLKVARDLPVKWGKAARLLSNEDSSLLAFQMGRAARLLSYEDSNSPALQMHLPFNWGEQLSCCQTKIAAHLLFTIARAARLLSNEDSRSPAPNYSNGEIRSFVFDWGRSFLFNKLKGYVMTNLSL